MGCDSISDGFWLWGLPMFAFFFFLVVVGLMIVGVVGFVTNVVVGLMSVGMVGFVTDVMVVVVVVGVAVVRAGSVAAWVRGAVV